MSYVKLNVLSYINNIGSLKYILDKNQRQHIGTHICDYNVLDKSKHFYPGS